MLFRLLLLLSIFRFASSTYKWNTVPARKAPIYEIQRDVFNKKVIDSYTADKSTPSATHTPTIDLNSNNPYKSNITRFAVYNKEVGLLPIPVYDLNNLQIKLIDDIFIECYEYNDCEYELTDDDRRELSLYASYIDTSGIASIDEPYSLGLIRSKFSENVLGMYTQGFSELNNQIGFWIRLSDNDNNRLYTQWNNEKKAIALLDLAVHERSHYDQPTYNNNAAHCDAFQSNYNFLFQRVARKFDLYKMLADVESPSGLEFSMREVVLIIVASVFFVISLILVIMHYNVSKKTVAINKNYLNY